MEPGTEPPGYTLDRFARAWLRCDFDELRDYLTEDALYSDQVPFVFRAGPSP